MDVKLSLTPKGRNSLEVLSRIFGPKKEKATGV